MADLPIAVTALKTGPRPPSYAVFAFLAGAVSSCLGIAIAVQASDLSVLASHGDRVLLAAGYHVANLVEHPEGRETWHLLLAGAAGAIAALAAPLPMARAAREWGRMGIYLRMLAGAVFIHAAYGLWHAMGLLLAAHFSAEGLLAGFPLGFYAALLGFPANAVFGLAFAEVLLWRTGRQASGSAAASQETPQ